MVTRHPQPANQHVQPRGKSHSTPKPNPFLVGRGHPLALEREQNPFHLIMVSALKRNGFKFKNNPDPGDQTNHIGCPAQWQTESHLVGVSAFGGARWPGTSCYIGTNRYPLQRHWYRPTDGGIISNDRMDFFSWRQYFQRLLDKQWCRTKVWWFRKGGGMSAGFRIKYNNQSWPSSRDMSPKARREKWRHTH